MKVCILGNGYMGSAFAFPLADNKIEINLWGTWLDKKIVDCCMNGYHPKLKKSLPENVSLYYSDELEKAVYGSDFIAIAVTSEGFVPVFERLLDVLKEPGPLICLTKGFVRYGDDVILPSKCAWQMLREKFKNFDFRWCSVGGPVKAVELSRFIPTCTVFGINNNSLKGLSGSFSTSYYRIITTEDVNGVELCSAFKNVYSIAVGVCDGMYEDRYPDGYHNFRAAVFTQGAAELSRIVEKLGFNPEIAHGLAGIGDLHVTSSSGRNRLLGYRIGRGMKPERAYEEMLTEELFPEGYNTLKLGLEFLKNSGTFSEDVFPLLVMLNRIIYEQINLKDAVEEFIINCTCNQEKNH